MNLPKVRAPTVARRLWSFDVQIPDELRYAAEVSIWVRWIVLCVILVVNSYRVEYGALSHILNTLYVLGLMVPNAYVHWRIRAGYSLSPLLLFVLSAVEMAALTFTMTMSGGFDSPYFGLYYLSLAMFSWLFISRRLVLSWVTLVAAVYVFVCLVIGDGVDFSAHEEKELFYRVLAMYGVALSINLITRFERMHRLEAVEREREMSRQRTEISQTIHDTTAQSAYMLGLGLEDAAEKARGSDSELAEKLDALWALSRSTMWTLRQPIDGGQIFSGSKLSEVLAAHADTFTVITSIPAELTQHGDEPQLSTITRSLLFSIAHNAMTNSYRHSGARRVTISLDFTADHLRLSVSDDGTGLPEDYASRGHGFGNIQADAERLGGALEVTSNGNGTTVSCAVPY